MTYLFQSLQFFGYCGLYPEEHILGNTFSLDVCLTTPDSNHNKRLTIEDVVDYESVYTLLKKEMAQPDDLLENVLHRLVNTLFIRHTMITHIKIRITKNTMPIAHFSGQISVEIEKHRPENT